MRIFSSLLIGVLFGIGLTVSQVINPEKIINFLDIAGNWDPSLLVVMGSALLTTMIGYRLVLVRKGPVLDEAFQIPTKTAIDRPLVIGSAVFGIGWGLAGFCPGPGISAASVGGVMPWAFIGAMTLGMWSRSFVKA